MGIIKCKMCGGDLAVTPGVTVGECEYCGTRQTLPHAGEELLQNLFNRANMLRIKCEFDKAEQLYERILQEDSSEAEAHWGIVLCKYGIEYVEDPKTCTRIPTCHRTSYDSILSDGDYLAALEKADPVRRSLYEAEGRAIHDIQKGILSIVREEKPFDVFLCYKEADENGQRTIDSAIANEIYHQLTQDGLKVFYAAITLEDKLGQAYEPYIFAALNSAKVMLVIGTKPQYFTAVWVKNEWSRFLKLTKTDHNKLLIPCYRDMDAYELPEEFAYLQAQDMSKIGFINDILRGIRKICSNAQPAPAATAQPAPAAAAPKENISQLVLEDDTLYEGETFADVPHGYGTAQYVNGNIYEGYWNRGKRHGKGKLRYSNGDVFEGEYKDNKQHGQGTLTWHDGSQWVGQFREGKRWTGKGVHYTSTENDITLRYEGQLEDGQYHGQGKITYTDSIYEGCWKNGKEHGQGTLIWNKGGQWSGQFREGKKWNGKGIWYYNDGCYEGPVVNGNRQGEGIFTWDSGEQWTGQFLDDKLWSGKGVVYTNCDGKTFRYDGQWENGNCSGYGKKIYNDRVYTGNWLDGKRHGQGILTWHKGGQWVGEFRDDKCWNGSGRWHYADAYYDGPWVEGKRQGHGIMVWNKGGQWSGVFLEDKCWNGSGRWYYADSCYDGPWVEGKRQGQGRITWDEGNQWIGEFYNDLKWNGQGVWYYSDSRYEGAMVGGQRHGNGVLYWNSGEKWEGTFKRNMPWNGTGTWYYDGIVRTGHFRWGRCLG